LFTFYRCRFSDDLNRCNSAVNRYERQYNFYNLLILIELNNPSFYSDDDNGYCRQDSMIEIKLQENR